MDERELLPDANPSLVDDYKYTGVYVEEEAGQGLLLQIYLAKELGDLSF